MCIPVCVAGKREHSSGAEEGGGVFRSMMCTACGTDLDMILRINVAGRI